ncbi:uncharacterized protein [Apostichopus japonicus]|uniref:uncharacterized protein n=1 Tax=Stichopus japonicus TaxID=307972 RepID=UPI003AB7F576
MTTGKRFFAFLLHCCLLLFTTSGEVIESSHSGNLELTIGVYEIERSKADDYLQSIADDDQCTDESPLEIVTNSIPGMTSNSAVGIIMYGTFGTDVDFDEADCQENVGNNSFRLVWLFLLTSRVKDGARINLLLRMFTDSQEPIFNPLLSEATRVDNITEDAGIVRMQDGSDVLAFQISQGVCPDGEDGNRGQDEWRSIRDDLWSSYPRPMDWSICDHMGWETSFCRALAPHKCSLSRYNNDFCIRFNKVSTKRRCKSNMKLIKATGMFLKTSLLGNEFPQDVYDAENAEGARIFDVVYPCFGNES